MEPIELNPEDFQLTYGSMMKEGKYIVNKDTPSGIAWYTPFEASGSYAVEATVKLDGENGHLGVVINGGKGDLNDLRFIIMPSGEVGIYSRNDVCYMKGSPNIYPTMLDTTFRVEVHPSQQLIVYYFNNKMFGEIRLNQPNDIKLEGTKVGLYFLDTAKAMFTDISICSIETPAEEDYVVETKYDENLDNEAIYPRASQKPAQTIYKFMNPMGLTSDEQLTLATLQGIVNKTEPRIYVDYQVYNSDTSNKPRQADWNKLLTEKGRNVVEVTSLEELLVRFKDDFKGIVTGDAYSPKTYYYEANIVTMLAGIYDVVYLNEEMCGELAEKLGKDVWFDTTDRWENSLHAYQWAYENLFPLCNQTILAHLDTEGTGHYTMPNRDYLVQNKIFTFYTSDVVTRDDYYFYLKIFASTPANTPVIGIASLIKEIKSHEGVMYEWAMFNEMANLGKHFTYTFSCANLSLLSGLEYDELKQPEAPGITLDPGKKYISLMASDGDNLSWSMVHWSTSYQDEDSRSKVAKGWSVPGAIYYVAPAALEYYYKNASPNDYFFLDGGGVGPIWALDTYGLRLSEDMREKVIDQYLAQTAYVMDKMDITVLKSWTDRYQTSDAALQRYAEALPNLNSIFIGYNVAVPYSQSVSVVNGVPVFRNVIVNAADARSPEANGAFLVSQINNVLSTVTTPAFAQSFVLGNYIVSDCEALVYVQENLGDDYEFVRPDVLGSLYRQYSE